MYSELSAQSSVSPSRMARQPASVSARLTLRPGRPGEGLGYHERLTEKTLQPARAPDDQPIAGAEFLDAEQSDDVLQILEPGERFAGAFGECVMRLADDQRIEQHGRGGERIDRRIERLRPPGCATA